MRVGEGLAVGIVAIAALGCTTDDDGTPLASTITTEADASTRVVIDAGASSDDATSDDDRSAHDAAAPSTAASDSADSENGASEAPFGDIRVDEEDAPATDATRNTTQEQTAPSPMGVDGGSVDAGSEEPADAGIDDETAQGAVDTGSTGDPDSDPESDPNTDAAVPSTPPSAQPFDAGVLPDADYAPGGPAESCSSVAYQDDGSVLLVAQEQHNYSIEVSWDVSNIGVAPNSELFFDWSDVKHDLLGHPISPLTDVDAFFLIVWKLPFEELVQRLSDDSLSAQYAHAAIAVYTDNQMTQAGFDDFKVAGGGELPRDELMARFDAELLDPAEYTYTVWPQSGPVIGDNAKAIQAFHLDPTSTNTTVVVDEDSTRISVDADLTSLLPTAVPTGESNIEMDWAQMETTASGRNWAIRSVDEVSVLRVPSSPSAIEERFVDLEYLADYHARGEVFAGDSINFGELSDEDGRAFEGITGSGAWYLVLQCSRCSDPSPWYVTQLVPCAD
jgi:hypothetical protein